MEKLFNQIFARDLIIKMKFRSIDYYYLQRHCYYQKMCLLAAIYLLFEDLDFHSLALFISLFWLACNNVIFHVSYSFRVCRLFCGFGLFEDFGIRVSSSLALLNMCSFYKSILNFKTCVLFALFFMTCCCNFPSSNVIIIILSCRALLMDFVYYYWVLFSFGKSSRNCTFCGCTDSDIKTLNCWLVYCSQDKTVNSWYCRWHKIVINSN